MKKTKLRKQKLDPRLVVVAVVVIVTAVLILPKAFSPVNTQCTELHDTTTQPPKSLISANDYFEQGNYDYDKGNCTQAITDYSNAITLNPKFAEAYNNRAYTYMMLNDYPDATSDLDNAISIRPNYVNALRNRGDIYNFYYQIDHQKALVDYDRVILIGGLKPNDLGFCNHRLLAIHGGWSIGVIWDLIRGGLRVGCDLPVSTK